MKYKFCSILLFFWGLLAGCYIPQRSLDIRLAETPLYPAKQWAIVNIPYTKVSDQLSVSKISYLLGMVRFGDIVEVLRIEKKDENATVWALILRQAIGKQAQRHDQKTIQGWVPYSFLHLANNFKEAQLASRQMLWFKNTAQIASE